MRTLVYFALHFNYTLLHYRQGSKIESEKNFPRTRMLFVLETLTAPVPNYVCNQAKQNKSVLLSRILQAERFHLLFFNTCDLKKLFAIHKRKKILLVRDSSKHLKGQLGPPRE